MSKTLLEVFISLLIGSTVVVNGISVHAQDIIKRAHSVTNQANVHQLETALAIYYIDHDAYPRVQGGSALGNELASAGYIHSADSFDGPLFDYTPKNDGQGYELSLRPE